MFTGLVETTGIITRVGRRSGNLVLELRADRPGFESGPGASVAVDGVCLTVESLRSGQVVVTAVQETLGRTTLGTAAPGRKVNLERALRLGDRLEGHLVLGHVDGVGRIVRDRDEGGSTRRTIAVPAGLGGLLAEKGSVAVDGVSLTVAAVGEAEFSVAIVPYTWKGTTMGLKRPGDLVNLECDVIARYVRRLLAVGHDGRGGRGDASGPDSIVDRLEGPEW